MDTNARRRSVLIVVTAMLVLGTTSALAWGNQGHETVCAIAYRLLTEAEQSEIDRLTKLYERPDGRFYSAFPEACTFADKARREARDETPGWAYFNRFNRWHFLNVPRDTHRIDAMHCGGNCVLEGIDYHSKRLARTDIEEWKRAEAMFFLGHWIGDLHQPLHISFADDQGGNNVQPIEGGFYGTQSYLSLHSVWDSGILRRHLGRGGHLGLAARLADTVTDEQRTTWAAASPVEWSQESYDVTTGKDTQYCDWMSRDEVDVCAPIPGERVLGQSYQNEFAPVVEMRLQQAGARLAQRIRHGLGLVTPGS